MGWILKSLAFVIAIVALSLGVWFIALPLFLYTFWGLVFGRRKKSSQVQVTAQYPDPMAMPRPSYAGATTGMAEAPSATVSQGVTTEPRGRARVPRRYIVGGLLLFLALIAIGGGGTYSPLVFGVSGVLILFWDRLARDPRLTSVHPIDESIALRRVIFPLQWVALGEIKLSGLA